MYHFSIRLLALFIMGACLNSKAQSTAALNFGTPVHFSVGNTLPPKLLTERTAVIVSPLAIPGDAYGRNNDWKALARQCHKQFQKTGIDAMAYFNIADVTADAVAKKTFSNMIRKRSVENLIFLSQTGANEYQILLTTFNQRVTMVNLGQSAAKFEGANLEQILTSLYRTIAGKSLPRQNYLIPDFAEFFDDIHLTRGRRYEEFAADLKIDKLAVPSFITVPIPKGLSDIAKKTFELYNEQMRKDSLELIEIMAEYPFTYEVFESKGDHGIYRNLGYQFVLLHLDAEGQSIKRMLNYVINAKESDYISVMFNGKVRLKTMPVNGFASKFYVKHISTKDVYLGTDWDADATWQQALRNYIRGLKKKLKVE